MASSSNSVGRPSKYRKKYCKEIIDYMSAGKSLTQFAAKIGVSKQSIYEWDKAHPEFSYALEIARTQCEGFWEQILQGKATGKLKGDTPMLMFWMKNRFGWSDRQAVEHSGPEGKPIETNSKFNLGSLSDDQLDQLDRLLEKAGPDSTEK